MDLDAIASALSGNSDKHPDYSNIMEIIIEIRDVLYRAIENGTGKWKRAFIITSNPDKNLIDSLAERLKATVYWMNTSETECLKNIAKDSNRNNKELFKKLVIEWFDKQK